MSAAAKTSSAAKKQGTTSMRASSQSDTQTDLCGEWGVCGMPGMGFLEFAPIVQPPLGGSQDSELILEWNNQAPALMSGTYENNTPMINWSVDDPRINTNTNAWDIQKHLKDLLKDIQCPSKIDAKTPPTTTPYTCYSGEGLLCQSLKSQGKDMTLEKWCNDNINNKKIESLQSTFGISPETESDKVCNSQLADWTKLCNTFDPPSPKKNDTKPPPKK